MKAALQADAKLYQEDARHYRLQAAKAITRRARAAFGRMAKRADERATLVLALAEES